MLVYMSIFSFTYVQGYSALPHSLKMSVEIMTSVIPARESEMPTSAATMTPRRVLRKYVIFPCSLSCLNLDKRMRRFFLELQQFALLC